MNFMGVTQEHCRIRLRLGQFRTNQRCEKLSCLVTNHMVAGEVGVSITEPAGKLAEVRVEAIVEDFDHWLVAGDDEWLHELATILGDHPRRE